LQDLLEDLSARLDVSTASRDQSENSDCTNSITTRTNSAESFIKAGGSGIRAEVLCEEEVVVGEGIVGGMRDDRISDLPVKKRSERPKSVGNDLEVKRMEKKKKRKSLSVLATSWAKMFQNGAEKRDDKEIGEIENNNITMKIEDGSPPSVTAGGVMKERDSLIDGGIPLIVGEDKKKKEI